MKRSRNWSRGLALVLCSIGTGLVVVSAAQLYTASRHADTSSTESRKTSSTIPASVQVSDDLDTTKPAADVLKNYSVAGDVPRALFIDKLGIRARVVSVGLNTDSSMQTPKNIYDSGWYSASAKPGMIGAMVIDGHASGASRMGLFAYIDTLDIGDDVTVERGDSVQFRYRVVHTETVSMNDVDMGQVMSPYGNAREGLTLITCTGKWIDSKQTYDHRVLVYAERMQ